jgi:hypothetical protein
MRSGLVKSALRSPVLHFAVLGVALFALATSRRGPSAEYFVGAAPSTNEEVLWQAATQSDVLRENEAVRDRLVKLARFLDLAAEDDDEALEAEARTLALDRTDRVVRRHVVETMRLALSRPQPEDVPSEDELRARLARDVERYRAPARIELTHVYLSRDRRGEAADDDAVALRTNLHDEGISPAEGPRRGDPFTRGARVSGSAAELDRSFGPGFAAALTGLPEGEWAGPIESALGVHVVWIHARSGESIPGFEAVRSRLTHAILREQGEQRLVERLASLREAFSGHALP